MLLASLFVNSCGTPLASVVPSITPPSEDEETKISREFRREAKKHLKFVTDPEVTRYIDRIGRRILSVMGPQSFDYRFFVVEDSQFNAFAVPGGSIYFYTGLIDKAKSSGEIAGVLGHELVHVKGRHMARSSGPDAISLLSLASLLLATRSSAGAEAASTVGQAVAVSRQIAYGRQLEMEADTLGLKYMTAAGYDPRAMLNFQKTMLKEQSLTPLNVPPYLLDHPLTQERISNAELVMRSMNLSAPVVDGPDPLNRIKTLIRIELNETDAVIAEQKKSVAETPKNSQAYQLLGISYLSKGMLQEAGANLEKAMALDPQTPGIDWDLGRLYTRLKNYPSAHTALDRALAKKSDDALTYMYLGELYEREEDLRSAAGAYLNAGNLAPLWDKPMYQLGMVYGKLDRLGDAHYYLGKSLLLQDEDEKAIANYEKAVKLLGENSPRAQLIKEELKTLRARKK
jgi:predicted Zn-dependent protease